VAEPFVDADDVAEVTAAALTQDNHAGQVYEVTGPCAVSFAGAVTEIAAVTGRPVRFQPVSTEQFAADQVEAGVPVEEAGLLRRSVHRDLDGRNAATTDRVQPGPWAPLTGLPRLRPGHLPDGFWDVDGEMLTHHYS
jgi:uncharacterized protein YbjT (DUF2867 family)